MKPNPPSDLPPVNETLSVPMIPSQQSMTWDVTFFTRGGRRYAYAIESNSIVWPLNQNVNASLYMFTRDEKDSYLIAGWFNGQPEVEEVYQQARFWGSLADAAEGVPHVQ